ncbi:hypothetical protein [Aquamicrobium sp. LC103]|uniref:hypothetical protein n=1 Tax=Aquamicrobium sp. LC103 TaxID=1120658 RepID=UPI00069C427D|nr:hypothetical protein [Aquamicrobium sp. LC103]TKT69764.1 hypothetical protein XW59_025055 [Aquamicrobium sp. LC103]
MITGDSSTASEVKLDLIDKSFATALDEEAIRLGGITIFNVRVVGDPAIQRIAAIRYASKVTLVTLALDGSTVSSVDAGRELRDFIAPLEMWTALSLREQAEASVAGYTDLLVGALRSQGHVPG